MKERDRGKGHEIQDLESARRRIEELEKLVQERTTTEETLRQSEQRYRRIVDTAYEGIWVFDEYYATTFVNKRMADMLGYTPEELMGKHYSLFHFGEDLDEFEKGTEARRQGIPGWYERKFRRSDGGVLWALVSATPILDEEGRFQGSFAMFTDITKRKEAEKALQASEAKYREIFENAVEGIFQSTPDGALITVNPAMARIFGYASREEMIAEVTSIGHQLYTNAEDRRTFIQLLEDHGIAGGFEARFNRRDGTFLWGTLNVRAVKDPSGKLLYYEGTLEDISARKRAEAALKESEEKYRDIFENAVEGIFQVTADGRYLSVNPALARIHGYNSPEEMMEKVTDIAHQLYVDPSRRDELMRRMREDGFVKGFEIMMRRKDGSLHWVSINSHAIRDHQGAILYHEGSLEDITFRRFAEEDLKHIRKSLEGTIRVLSAAVELRDPAKSGHHRRVSALALALAEEMDLPQDMREGVRMGALIHDLGKVSVPGEILNKPVTLTEREYDLVKIHPRTGYELLRDAGLPYPVAEIVFQHHERLDGSGYPLGLKGNEILMEARVVAVADVVEAMVSNRPYRPARGLEAALDEIEKNQGTRYDPKVVERCLKLFRRQGFRFP